MSERLPWAGAVLAGGRSRRMGKPKESVVLPGGAIMIELILDELLNHCPVVVVVGTCAGYDLSSRKNVLHITDLRPGHGPLSGIEALLASRVADGYLVTGCDQPGLTSDLLSRLPGGKTGRFFRNPSDGSLAPLPGYFPSGWLSSLRRAIDEDRLSLRRFIESEEVESLPLLHSEGELLSSLNTPQDVERFGRRQA